MLPLKGEKLAVASAASELPNCSTGNSYPTTYAKPHQTVLLAIRQRFPAAFAKCQPLKIGIYDDIRAAMPEIASVRLLGALGFYTGRITYLTASVEGAARIDLDGCVAGTVTAVHAARAQLLLKKIKTRPRKAKSERITLAGLREAAQRRRSGGAV
jgi:sRNA-binding protein